jgi:cell division protease FtsH
MLWLGSDAAADRRVGVLHAPDAGRRQGGAFSFGKSKARMLDENNNTVTFADVAGCDEAKEEVKELVDFLKDPPSSEAGRPHSARRAAGRPSGTGKTLLAKAIAGEAKVPFFSISVPTSWKCSSASVRPRARHVRAGQEAAPCIIFIDEIDAVGRHRGAGLGGGNDEREQT